MPKLTAHPRTGKPLLPVGYTASGRAVYPILGASEDDVLARLTELSARLNDTANPLTDAELTELQGILAAEVAASETADPTDENIEHIVRVADWAEAAAAEQTARETAAVERTTARDDALARARGAIVVVPEPEVVPVVDEGVEVETPEPVAASTRPRPVPLSQVRQTRRPEREPEAVGDGRIRATLTASSGPTAGQGFGTGDDQLINLAEAFDTAFRDARSARSSGRVLVASSRYSVSDEQVTSDAGAATNRSAMDRALKAVTASGGLCRPLAVDYNVPLWSNVEEPVKAALPSIDAPRGGITYMTPVAYDATVYGAGVAIWTEANDANPGGANTGPGGTGTGPTVKPCVEIDCSGTTDAVVEAITQCAQVSNFRGRFSPENVEVLMTYLQQAFVATAEKERLRQMRAAAKHATVAQAFGASRDILNFLDRLRAYFRNKYRLSDNVPLRAVMNAYTREVIRTDLRKAAFPYEGDGVNSLFIPDAQIDAWLGSVGITPVWALDDDTADQTFATWSAGTQGSPTTFPAYPFRSGHTGTANIRILAYPEGTYQRLDGGELNLGVVRDSALNAVNKYQVFSEIFEVVAMRGFEAVDFVGDFIPNGATAGTQTPA